MCAFHGIIPTRVGTSSNRLFPFLFPMDHPHACGDKKIPTPIPSRTIGSSPRVWGQVCTSRRFIVCNRIIPTRVGTRENLQRFYPMKQDHPHACGDKTAPEVKVVPIAGSSPRVWGQVKNSMPLGFVPGIIPTRVGTRVLRCVFGIGKRDHPHACGDKTKEIKENSGFAKSTA